MKTVDYILLLIFSNTNLYKQIQRWHVSKFNDWCLGKQSLIIVLKGSMCSSHSKIKQPSNSNLGFVPNESILLKCPWDLLRLEFIRISIQNYLGFPTGSAVMNLPAVRETQEMRVWSFGWEDPLKEEMATHSSISWKIPQTEQPGGLQFIGLQRVGHNGSTCRVIYCSEDQLGQCETTAVTNGLAPWTHLPSSTIQTLYLLIGWGGINVHRYIH